MQTTHLTRLPILALCLLAALPTGVAGAEEKANHELAVALQGATVTLSQGLAASAAAGTPIPAKFEIEDGKRQLSVYTQAGCSWSRPGSRSGCRPPSR